MPQTIHYHSDPKIVQVPHTPNTHAHKQPFLPSSQPPPHYFAKPHSECKSLLHKKYCFLKSQISQKKATYPNSSCTCQINIIRIPYRNKCFIPSLKKKKFLSLPKLLAPLDAFVIQEFQSTVAIREGIFFNTHTHPPPPALLRATTGKTHQTPVLHRCRCLGSPRALSSDPRLCPLGRPSLTLNPTGPFWGAARGARPGSPLGEGGRGDCRCPRCGPGCRRAPLPRAHPPGAAPGSAGSSQRGWGREGGGERVRLLRRLLPAGGAGESLACHGTGDTASCITSGGPSLTPGSSPPPHVSQGPRGCWRRAAPARPGPARPEAPGRLHLRRGAAARPDARSAPRHPPAQPPPPRPERAGGRPTGPGPLPGCGDTGGAPVSAAETPAARDRAVRLPPRGKSYREVSPRI